MCMVIYAHPMCTYLLLNVYVSCIRNFIHKKWGCFWQVRLITELFNIKDRRQQPAQTERQTMTTAAV